MKLSKLYCDKPFHNIKFNTLNGGLNMILADVKTKQNENDTHNLGKTKLIELIDFLLLKGIKKSHWLLNSKKREGQNFPIIVDGSLQYIRIKADDQGQPLFKNYTFYLEILLNSNKYLTIKRGTTEPSKISFKISDESVDEFIAPVSWDDENISFNKAKLKLNELLDFGFSKKTKYDYRKSINYSLRMQGDYDYARNSIFQLGKFKGKDVDWKPFMFYLLGFEGNLLNDKYHLEEKIKKAKDLIKEQEKDIGVTSQEKDELIGQLQIKEQERQDLTETLDKLNFYQKDKEVIIKLVEDIESEIALLNSELYQIEFDIKKLNESIKNDFAFDLNKVKKIFEEVELYFPDNLAKSYEQLIDFNKKITSERNTHIRQTLTEKEVQQVSIENKLNSLHKQKEEHATIIQGNDIFKKYKGYQKQLIQIENDLVRLQTRLERLEEVEKKQEEVQNTQRNSLQKVTDKIKNTIKHTFENKQYSEIRKSFAELAKRIFYTNAYLAVTTNRKDNVEFECKFDSSSRDEGTSYYKLLCVAFDLSILKNYLSQSYFRFVYHDDVFSQLDNRRKESLMSVIREFHSQYNIQYICSIIRDDIPNTESFKEIEKSIILTLHDRDDTGKLFKMSF